MSHQRPLRRAAQALTAAILLILVAGCSEPVVQPGAVRWSPPASPGPGDVRWSGNLAEDGAPAP
ncbi:hypothetical protein [Allorhizocola rhizosphaerae]|uniref:hypothetical protein n=1 Tax=Allorhizocola rhizosphaerae TaxID=1872709 RepID=UPI0013C3377D|nr:hypothetical protein [Allorhizocola rhizosphaerae]